MTLISDIISNSPDDTERVGAELAQKLLDCSPDLPSYIAMYGDLGVGKTAFVRGMASVLAQGCIVRSPTFAIVNEYRCKAQTKPLFHFDMYRITSEDDLYSCGYDDYIDGGICVVEWSENIPFALPDEYIKVSIEKMSSNGENKRHIIISLES